MNFLIKLFAFSLLLWTADQWFDDIYYPSWFAVLTTSLALTVTGVVADKRIVPVFGNALSTFAGYFGIALIVWAMAWLLPGSHVRVANAFVISLPAAIMEFFLHRYVSPGVRHS